MFAIPGLIILIALIYARPQEFIEPLQTVPLLYVFFAVAVLGWAIDLRLRYTRLTPTPQLPWVALFVTWALVSSVLHTPRQVHLHALALAIPIVLYLVIAHGVQTLRALNVLGAMVLAMTLFVAAVGVHQGFADTGCIVVDESQPGDQATGTYDGRPCQQILQCYQGDAEPGAEYLCEHIGLFGTTSISNGRIRYRGVLQDPNELALAACIGIPLAFATGRRKSSLTRGLITVITLGIVLMCAVLTQSRGGQLVFLAVLGAYFLKRFGFKGAIVGALVGVPLLLLGGRHTTEADVSTMERIDCWREALDMFRSNPLFGVGFQQFGEYHYLTAHNSYLLTLAELGFPGMLLFSIIVYLSVKIPYTLVRRQTALAQSGGGEAADRNALVWAMAMLAGFSGLVVGVFFLSFAYHPVFWIYVGLTGALYVSARRHDPEFVVRFGWRDLLLVTALDVAMIVGTFVYARAKLG